MTKNNSGFSLIQVLVAAGILGIISMAFVQLSKNMVSGQKYIQTRSDVSSLNFELKVALAKDINCKDSMVDSSGRKITIDPNIESAIQRIVVDSKTLVSMGSGAADMGKISLVNKLNLRGSEYLMTLVIQPTTRPGATPIKATEVPVFVKLSSTSQVEGCSTESMLSAGGSTSVPPGTVGAGCLEYTCWGGATLTRNIDMKCPTGFTRVGSKSPYSSGLCIANP